MNDGDVFLLVTPKFIYVWTGKKANYMERVAAIRLADEIKNENSKFHLKIIIVEDGKESEQLIGDEEVEFAKHLPLDRKDDELVKSTESEWTESDASYETSKRELVHLYRCVESEFQIDIKSVKSGPLSKEDLDSNVSS